MYTEWNNRWDVQLYKQVHANIKASRQRWHTDCKQINSEQCCRTNTNDNKRGHKRKWTRIVTHSNSFGTDTVLRSKYTSTIRCLGSSASLYRTVNHCEINDKMYKARF